MALRAWWKFDEGSGVTAADSSGNALDGSLDGTAAWSGVVAPITPPNPASIENQPLGRVALPAVLTIGPTSSFTLAGWVNPSSFQSGMGDRRGAIAISSAPGEFTACLGMSFDGANAFGIDVGVSGSSYQSATSPVSFNTGQWYHLAARFNSSGSAELFVDGVAVASVTYDASTILAADNSGDWSIGSEPYLGGGGSNYDYPWHGYLDDFRVFDSSLSDAEIAALAGAVITDSSSGLSGLSGLSAVSSLT